MKKFDDNGLLICRFQGNIFLNSKKLLYCSSAVFIRRFMLSQAARRLDCAGFESTSENEFNIIEEVEEEYGVTHYGKELYDEEELYWIGYIYRYWCYTYELSSKYLYKLIKPKELRAVYYPYHSLDPSQAIERIIEAKDLNMNNQIEKGVKLYREIWYRNNKKKDS